MAVRTFNIREAKTQLSRLVELAAKVMPLDAPDAGQVKRLGFISGQIAVPDDFDRLGSGDLEQSFGGAS